MPPPREHGRTRAGVGMAAVLALVQLGIWSRAVDLPYMQLGSASGQRILDGELWRVVTALCLHVDALHLFGNVMALGIFASALAWSMGPGVAALLIVLSGALGNCVNAWLQGPAHDVVGASTAVFGAIGILAGLQAVRRWRGELWKGRAWLPLAGGLALLGAVACALAREPPTRPTQTAAGLGSLCLLAGSWWLALTAATPWQAAEKVFSANWKRLGSMGFLARPRGPGARCRDRCSFRHGSKRFSAAS